MNRVILILSLSNHSAVMRQREDASHATLDSAEGRLRLALFAGVIQVNGRQLFAGLPIPHATNPRNQVGQGHGLAVAGELQRSPLGSENEAFVNAAGGAGAVKSLQQFSRFDLPDANIVVIS